MAPQPMTDGGRSITELPTKTTPIPVGIEEEPCTTSVGLELVALRFTKPWAVLGFTM